MRSDLTTCRQSLLTGQYLIVADEPQCWHVRETRSTTLAKDIYEPYFAEREEMVRKRPPVNPSARSDEVRAASCLDAIEATGRALAVEMYEKTHGLKRSSSLLDLPPLDPKHKKAANIRSAYISRNFLEKTYIPGLEEGLRQQKEELTELERQRDSMHGENESIRQQIWQAQDDLFFKEVFHDPPTSSFSSEPKENLTKVPTNIELIWPPCCQPGTDKPFDFKDFDKLGTDMNVGAFYDFIDPWSTNCEWNNMVRFDMSSSDVMFVPIA
jgi:hypothetical protein